MTHKQHAQFIATANDFVVQNALAVLHLPIAHAQLQHAVNCDIGWVIGVVHGWSVRIGAVCIFYSEVFAHGVRLTVANNHAEVLTTWHPTAYPCFHARLCNADLVARTIVVMRVCILWHPLFVCAPTKFCRCNAFFVEAFNGPRVAKLVDFFWLVGNLRVAFGNMNDFGASELREHIELLGFKSSLQCRSATSCLAVIQ